MRKCILPHVTAAFWRFWAKTATSAATDRFIKKCFIGCAGEDFGESNLGTYYVPIYSSADENKMVNNIWMIDSGTYNDENDLGGYRDDNNGIQYEKQQSLL